MARVTVTDPEGETVTVRRWWWRTIPWETGFSTLDAVIFLLVLPFMVMWPFWLLLKWLGVSWKIVIERDGERIGRERVRGWRRSGERIYEIAASVQAGTYPVDQVDQPTAP
ncbi:hypothetical protein AU190_21820 [Mycolicibacterium acapulense]|nr:hypothetical protein AU190_21820 [Mycolicibacterium acapulense]KUH98527.1 hypothetical protein AU189_05410 [Mycolicibacterium acapulense]